MSYTTLLKIYKTKTSEVQSYNNSWGTSPLLWDYLVKTYIGDGYTSLIQLELGGRSKLLWDLFKDETVPIHLRVCLLFTCDHAYCPADRIQEFADYCLQTYETINDPNKVNNWKDIGETLKTIKLDRKVIGVGMQQSQSDLWEEKSAHENMFNIFEFVYLFKL